MVTYITDAYSIEYRGLSTDNKPMNVQNGAVFFEMDTGEVFLFDKENRQWRQQ